jgi:glycosyltransferase involved in cell wall biosynthesis
MATGGFRFSTRLPKIKRLVLAILTTHPIQYQVPLWQALARDGRVPFEVWYLSKHAAEVSRDRDFGKSFAWDLDMLAGYPHQFLDVDPGAAPNDFWKCRLRESLAERMRAAGVKALWIQGWQVAAYWQAVWAAKKSGAEVWLRGESNDLAPTTIWKRAIKRVVLGQLFRRVDRFLSIGTANRRLYEKFGVSRNQLYPAPYAVDNERFRQQANKIRKSKLEIRKQWNIPGDAFCVLFCGKFIPKKRPLDLVAAVSSLVTRHSSLKIHPLFAGSGELGEQLRANCNIMFDAENPDSSPVTRHVLLPNATFAGFLNQTEVSRAYIAADCLVLPSDYRETWGLVVNEAMASGLRCVISDQCGCAEDLGAKEGNAVFRCREVSELAVKLLSMATTNREPLQSVELPSFATTVATVARLYV